MVLLKQYALKLLLRLNIYECLFIIVVSEFRLVVIYLLMMSLTTNQAIIIQCLTNCCCVMSLLNKSSITILAAKRPTVSPLASSEVGMDVVHISLIIDSINHVKG
jgi:hypothetical protein